jgi:hypothetical protein
MSQTMGICAIIPRGQGSYQPTVFGMGILVTDTEIVTCAHVIAAALKLNGHTLMDESVVSVCFPFVEGKLCVDGDVDPTSWLPPTSNKGRSDIAVIRLRKPAPSSVEPAVLKESRVTEEVLTVYGFRSQQRDDGSWVSHPTGEHSQGHIVGPLPDGRGQFDGLPITGAAVQHGFSGAGIYDRAQDAIVGMVVEVDRSPTTRLSQFINALCLEELLVPTGDRSQFPDVPKMADYSNPRKRCKILLTLNPTYRVLLLHGNSGMGKSTILKFCREEIVRTGSSICCVDVDFRQAGVDVAEILFCIGAKWGERPTLARRLRDMEGRLPDMSVDSDLLDLKKRIGAALQVEDRTDREYRRVQLTDALFQDAESFGRRTIVLFDAYEKAPRGVQEWISGPFLRGVHESNSMRIVIAGQDIPQTTNGDWRCYYEKLSGVIQPKYWMPFLQGKVPQNHAETLLNYLCPALKGRPLDISQIIEKVLSNEQQIR